MARKKVNDSGKRPIESYDHKDKERLNNPPVGLVSTETDKDLGKKKYAYDPHLDPQLVWAGKAEHTSFEVPTVSLHVHERIDPKTIINAVRKKNGGPKQGSLFESPEENPPLRNAIEFYKHSHNWSNRLVAGDSLLVMNSLIEKEGMAGKVQMVYIDPPYGIHYNSNFQPFVNSRRVADRKDEDLTREPEMIKAFRDTWSLEIHSYLTYLRDRLLTSKQLLHESGSCFVQISDKNLHLIRSLMDEVFGKNNFVAQISFRKKTMPMGAKFLEEICDYIIFYAVDKTKLKYRQLFREVHVQGDTHWNIAEFENGTRRQLTKEEIFNHALVGKKFVPCQLVSLSPIGFVADRVFPIKIGERDYNPSPGKCWKTDRDGISRLLLADRLLPYESGNRLRYLLKLTDYPVTPLNSIWDDTSAPTDMRYVVETSPKVITRCILMSTDPGDLVLDPTCGSGTTPYVAEKWGRRWISCDSSRVSLTLAKQRLMTAFYDYYELAHQEQGIGSGLAYNKVPHVTLDSIAKNERIREGMSKSQIESIVAQHSLQETLYDSPSINKKKIRVTGPFTVEAVPAPVVKALVDVHAPDPICDTSVGSHNRGSETVRISQNR